MFIFQELLEDVLDINKNLKLSKLFIDEDTVVLDINDWSNTQILIKIKDNEELFELRYVENGFIDSIYKPGIFDKENLYNFASS